MNRYKAKSSIQVDNKQVRITKYLFQPGEETRMHKHQFDYVVTPITNGKLILIDKKGNKTSSTLIAAKSYFRRAGIEHNVINNGEERLIFIETEIKNILREV